MVISEKLTEDKNLLSVFAMSKLWVRQVSNDMQYIPLTDCVNPLKKDLRGSTSNCLRVSQRRKQWLGGWALKAQVRGRLWQGISANSQQQASWIDVLGYDGTLVQAIQRSADQGETHIP